MDTLTLGPLILKKSLLIWAIAAAAGYGVVRLRARGRLTGGDSSSILLNAIMWGVLVWKGSVLLWDPMGVLRQPMSLIYFTGGVRGAWLGAVVGLVTIGYHAYRKPLNKHVYLESVIIFLMGAYSVKVLLDSLLGEGHLLSGILLTALGLAVIYALSRQSHPAGLRALTQFVIVFLVGHALIASLAMNLWEKPNSKENTHSAYGLNVGQLAPDFEAPALDGGISKLSEYRGKTVVLNFWATWCPPCRAEMPHMQRFSEQYSDDVVVLGVNATTTEASAGVVDAWVKEWGLTFPIPLDKQGEIIAAYRIDSYPTTYIVDPEGRILNRHQGPMNYDMLKEATGK